MRRILTWGAACLLAAAACGRPPVAPDAGDLGAEPTSGEPALPEAPRVRWLDAGRPDIAPPRISWLEAGVPPIAWACPTGWRGVDADGVRTCEPYPAGGSAECAEGEAHFPGEAGCRPIGRACGVGPFPGVDDLPDGTTVLFVRSDADASGDGSEGAPLRTLAEALERASPGDVVALAAGTYAVDRVWPDGVSLRGRCVRDTVLVAAEDSDRSAVLDIGRHDASIRIESVRIGPASVTGLRVRRRGAPVAVEGVEIREATGTPAALSVTSSGEVEARSIVVRDTRDPGMGPEQGSGVSVEAQGRLTLAGSVLDGNRSAGLVVADEGSHVVATDLRVRRTRGERGTGLRGFGVLVVWGRLELRRVLLDGNRDAGLLAIGPGTEVTASDLVVRDTLPQASDGGFGRGLSSEQGARLDVTRALIERNLEHGVVAANGGEAVVRDAVVRDTEARADGFAGRGVSAEGGRVQLERALVVRNRGFGVLVADELSEVVAADLAVRDTRPRATDGARGFGVLAQLGGRLQLSRALLADHRWIGLGVISPGTLAEVEDLVVRGGEAGESDPGVVPAGVVVGEASELTLRRALLERPLGAGVVVREEGATADIEDLTVMDAVRYPDGPGSAGVSVALGGRLLLSRASIASVPGVGLAVVGDASTAVARGVVVRDTQPDPLLTASGGGGMGVVAESGARLELDEALIEGNRSTGVIVDDEATEAVLRDVVVRDTRPQAFASSIAEPGEFGRAIDVNFGARLVLARALLTDNGEVGLFVGSEGTRVEATDLRVARNSGQALDGLFGQGVKIQLGPTVSLTRVLVEDVRAAGVEIVGGQADIRDLTVLGTAPDAEGHWGRGLNVALGSVLSLRRARLEGNPEAGFYAHSPGTRADVRDLVVTGSPDCSGDCAGGAPEVSLGAYAGADVDVTGFVLENSETCGVRVTDDAQLDLRDGEVTGHPIGVCCESDYPLARLRRGVAYRDNGIPVECSTFEVPRPDLGAVER
ncbi:MAG: DUF1565 domain-containing protein [Sandaracinaceae bacterium]